MSDHHGKGIQPGTLKSAAPYVIEQKHQDYTSDKHQLWRELMHRRWREQLEAPIVVVHRRVQADSRG